MKHSSYDLLVVGAGMVGLTLLAALQPAIRQGLGVALVDAGEQPAAGQPTSPMQLAARTTALSQQSLSLLSKLSLPSLTPLLTDIAQIEVSDRGHLGYHLMRAHDQGFARYGAVITNATLTRHLWQQVQALPIDFYFADPAAAIQRHQRGAEIWLRSGRKLTAGFVIVCTGDESTLLAQVGMQAKKHAFNAYARVAGLKTTVPPANRAFERFTQSGPLALLPYGDYCSLVWTLNASEQATAAPDETAALAWLNQAFGQRLGRIIELTDWLEYPLTQLTLSYPLTHHLLALGNAATRLHPVAGQGFNLAVRAVAQTAVLVNQSWLQQKTLPSYADWSKLADNLCQDQQRTVGFTHGLVRLFGSTNPLLCAARGAALSAFDRHPALHRSLALAAMGLLDPASLELNLSTNGSEGCKAC